MPLPLQDAEARTEHMQAASRAEGAPVSACPSFLTPSLPLISSFFPSFPAVSSDVGSFCRRWTVRSRKRGQGLMLEESG